jgi:hypothetical protein
VVVHAYNPSTWEVEAGGSQVGGLLVVHSETLEEEEEDEEEEEEEEKGKKRKKTISSETMKEELQISCEILNKEH